MLLDRSENQVTSGCKCKRQLETDITTIRKTSILGDWSNPPNLGHASNHSSNTEAESKDSSNTWWKSASVQVIFNAVSVHSMSEYEMISKGDTLVDGKPVTNKIHEILENGFEMRISWDCDGNISTSSNSDPDETRNLLSPLSENLQSQGDRVNVWNVVANDGQSEDDEAEFAKATKWWEKDSSQETTNTSAGVSIHISVITSIDGSGREDGSAQELSEEKREDESSKGGEENLGSAVGVSLIDSVISSITRPARSETEDDGTER